MVAVLWLLGDSVSCTGKRDHQMVQSPVQLCGRIIEVLSVGWAWTADSEMAAAAANIQSLLMMSLKPHLVPPETSELQSRTQGSPGAGVTSLHATVQSRFRVRSPVKKAHTESAALAEPSVKELGRGHNRDLGLVSAPLSPQAALGDKGGRTPQPCVPRGFSSEPPHMDEAVAACKCQKQRRRVTRCTSPQGTV
ncbi:hypothetical protein CB1_001907080 [Camelus ferus]|nr:hypothetical protein CB1_001907080 [Camelus ferus]